MRIFATSALLCGLLLFAACGDESASDQGTNNNTPAPDPTPAPPPADPGPPATETVFLDVSGMT